MAREWTASRVTIRPETSEDVADVRRVNELAFGKSVEANLVNRLRQACADALSLVAEDGVIVGQLRFRRSLISVRRPNGYLLSSYRIATAPEPNSSRLTSFKSIRFDSPANNVGPMAR